MVVVLRNIPPLGLWGIGTRGSEDHGQYVYPIIQLLKTWEGQANFALALVTFVWVELGYPIDFHGDSAKYYNGSTLDPTLCIEEHVTGYFLLLIMPSRAYDSFLRASPVAPRLAHSYACGHLNGYDAIIGKP
ncbi:hypothetical protein VNO77_07795 [Canavalia gladiata]|uniref:Uncharacterized protein n=1 Tax=Canavalia gladiata TaxID=3824 RepID=A0AAN9M8R5_CANGL